MDFCGTISKKRIGIMTVDNETAWNYALGMIKMTGYMLKQG